MNMKYLKPASAILVGSSTSGFDRATTEEYMVTLGLTTFCSNGSGEELQGIYVTRSQLEQIREEIDNCLRDTANGDTEKKQRLKINPELVKIELSTVPLSKPFRASIDQACINYYSSGGITLQSVGNSEKESRTTLDEQFKELVMKCTDTGLTKPKISNATLDSEFDELRQEIQRTKSNPKTQAIMQRFACIAESEQAGQKGADKSKISNATPSSDNLEKVDAAPAGKSEKTDLLKTEGKNQVFKLNPNRVASRRDPTIEGYGQWEARTTLYFGETPLEVVSSGHMMEESARTALDYKVGRLIDGMTD